MMTTQEGALQEQRRRDSMMREEAQRCVSAQNAVLVIATHGGSTWEALMELARRMDKEDGDASGSRVPANP